MNKAKLRKAIKDGINRHKIRFPITSTTCTPNTCAPEVLCVMLARAGRTTESIAKTVRMSKSKVQYRIKKGGGVGVRAKFRNGQTWESQEFLKICGRRIINDIAEKVTPKFI